MMDYKPIEIGNFIEQNREGLGLTAKKLAEMLGVSPVAVSKWEHGCKSIDKKYMALLADLFGITVENLIKRENTPYYDIKRTYDLSEYIEGEKFNCKKLQTKEAKEEFINIYFAGMRKFKDIIKQHFDMGKSTEAINDGLEESFIRQYEVEYEGKPLNRFKIIEYRTKMTFDEFSEKLVFKRNEALIDLMTSDKIITKAILKIISREDKNKLLKSIINRKVKIDFIIGLIREGAVLTDEDGNPDYKSTLQLIQKA